MARSAIAEVLTDFWSHLLIPKADIERIAEVGDPRDADGGTRAGRPKSILRLCAKGDLESKLIHSVGRQDAHQLDGTGVGSVDERVGAIHRVQAAEGRAVVRGV